MNTATEESLLGARGSRLLLELLPALLVCLLRALLLLGDGHDGRERLGNYE